MQTSLKALLNALLPDMPPLQLSDCWLDRQTITLVLQTTTSTAACPQCAHHSHRIRTRYWRTLWDLPWADKVVRLRLRLRKFACINPDCPRRIFAERIPCLSAYARCTPRRHAVQIRLGLALGGEAGARLSYILHLDTSPATLLRRLRQLPEPEPTTPRALGVDDWAFRKGMRYGTVLVDLEAHRPIDLLPERTAEALIAWLKQQPQIQILCRDRSTEYARAANEGAPQAVQVADRFHLVANLRDTLQHLVERHRSALAGIVIPSSRCSPETTLTQLQSRRPDKRSLAEEARRQAAQQKRRERHARIHTLKAQGASISEIARTMHLHRVTVYRNLRLDAASAAQRRHHSTSKLDAYIPYLQMRWEQGCSNAMQLWREIAEQGYSGTHKMVNVWAQQQRLEPAPTTVSLYRQSALSPSRPEERLPTPRTVAFFLIRRAQCLSTVEKQVLAQIQQASPEIAAGYTLFHQFAALLRERAADKLSVWMHAAYSSGLSELQAYATGLEKDRSAVEAAVSQSWSNAQTEGQVTRLKLLKRQMYGRAKFDLLRRRVLST
jgi:transposase